MDGSHPKLIFVVHKYLDVENSGTYAECVTKNICSSCADAPLDQETVLLSETGGGNAADFVELLCQEIAFLNENTDVDLGCIGWAA